MVYAEKKYGKLTLQQVMAPAIKLAREGFPLTREEAQMLHDEIWEVCGVAENLSARREILQAGRDFPPARSGADT